MRKKLPLSTLQWLVITSTVYGILGLVNLFIYRFADLEVIQAVWVLITALPVFVPMYKIVDIHPFGVKK